MQQGRCERQKFVGNLPRVMLDKFTPESLDSLQRPVRRCGRGQRLSVATAVAPVAQGSLPSLAVPLRSSRVAARSDCATQSPLEASHVHFEERV